MKYLVTGGAGFLGSALANRLAEEGHEVRVLDNLRSGRLENLDERVLFTQGDVADIPKLWTLLQDVDCVFHLAARVAVAESIQYPREYNHDNVGGTVSVMEAMRDVGVRRVVFTSSGAVYGEQKQEILNESLTANPSSPYAVSKLASEAYIRTIGRLWNIETVSLRIFNAYGPNQQVRPSHPPVIPHFLKAVTTGSSIVIHGDGRQTRDFIYVDDVVAAMVSAAFAPGVDQRVINIGSGEGTTMLALVGIISRIMGKEIQPIVNPSQSGGVRRMCADISLASEMLGFSPSTTLEDGLRKTLLIDFQYRHSDQVAK